VVAAKRIADRNSRKCRRHTDHTRTGFSLQPNSNKALAKKPPRKFFRRLEKIEDLPRSQQSALLRTIDIFLENAALKAARRPRAPGAALRPGIPSIRPQGKKPVPGYSVPVENDNRYLAILLE